ncbi:MULTISPECIES: ArsC/Spx/MgsR family protein [unclassified Ruegeria]|uniref:ArsC/Spx/MgsR family protein n=1 Tax=unclassified Ruegeria TaxID=2625375 RepID=UPI001AE100FA|nr:MULTISPECIES: ArsC/Spx/MgsR family protein [unclassified Ruegeria]
MQLYGLKNCDTCRKALKSLPDVKFSDVRSDGVPDSVLSQAFAEFGNDLLNTRSTTWRGLDETQRAKAPLELLKEHPTLMKRPLIEVDGRLLLGWTAETRAQLGIS